MLEPVPGEPAAIADCGPERALVVADYHAGLEIGLRRDGVEINSRAERRLSALTRILADSAVDRVVFLGDLGDSLGTPKGDERAELRELFEAVAAEYPITVVKGNHDGGIEALADVFDRVEITDGE